MSAMAASTIAGAALPGLVARAEICATLSLHLREGRTVLVWGPVGIGKTAVLRSLEARFRACGTPCGLSATTDGLADLDAALARAYPNVDATGGARRARARLRSAVEKNPAVLLLDGLGATGTAFKGALRSLRGTGIGILLAADVDQSRDHDRVRALGLAGRELELVPLHGRSMRTLLEALLDARPLPHRLTGDDLRALADDAEGLPGRAVWFADALANPIAWHGGRVRRSWLRSEAAIAAMETYRGRAP